MYGRGFGFRGSSPPWPYAGRGRGGLPRCWYPGLNAGYGTEPYYPQMSREQEISFLKEESNALERQLEEIRTRITQLEETE